MKRLKYWFLTLLFIVTVSACGQGGGGIGGTGKIERYDGLIVGAVDSFGSIVINGNRYETDDTNIYIDGREASLTDIRIGMKVSAKTRFPQNTATELHYQPTVSGPVSDLAGETFEVFGNTVRITDQTVLDELAQSELADGLFVEISGDRNSRDEIVARYIRRSNSTQSVYTVGTVALADDGVTWLVAGKEIDFSAAAESIGFSLQEFASHFLWPGATVRISSTDQQLLPNESENCSDASITSTLDSGNESIAANVSTSDCDSGVDGVDGGDAVNGDGGDGGDGGDAVNGNGGDGGDGGDGGNSASLQLGSALSGEIQVRSVSAVSAPVLSAGDYVQIVSTVSVFEANRFYLDGYLVTITTNTDLQTSFGLPADWSDFSADHQVEVVGIAESDGREIMARTIRLLDVH